MGEKASVTLLFVALGLFAPVSPAWAKKDKLEVTLTAPAAGALYNAPAAVVLSAIAQTTQKNHPIAKVEFFQGANLIGAVAGPRRDDQYTLNWTGVAAGNYAVTAKATNDKGDTDLSDPVSITVNALPSVSLTSPGSNAAFKAPANIPLAVQVADTDGSIANVEYFYGTTLITSLSAPPYSFVWTEVPQGTYALTARVTDNLGGAMTSVAVNVTVNAAEAKLYYIHVDHLNTPRLIADATGTTVWRWDQQEPFGVNVPDENASGLGPFEFPMRFPGQYADKETNLAYNYFRDYDPAIGRYIQTDPLGARSGKHLFLYSSGNPLSHIDYYALRDVIVTIWDRSIQNGSPAGHVFVGEMNGTTILSQFPSPSGIQGTNVTRDWFDTLISEMKNPDVVYKVHVSDDAKFDQAVKDLRQRPDWFWNPRSDPNSTNCSAAAFSALRAGGVSVPEPWVLPVSPDDLRSGMEQLIRKNSQNVTRLPSVPWK